MHSKSQSPKLHGKFIFLKNEMNKDIIVKKSGIDKKGIFAGRDFKKGEVVLKWNPKLVREDEIEKMSQAERTYIMIDKGLYYLMQKPERYMNHSCDSNTKPSDQSDVAIRDIKKGEEITSDYGDDQSIEKFECSCGGENCRGLI